MEKSEAINNSIERNNSIEWKNTQTSIKSIERNNSIEWKRPQKCPQKSIIVWSFQNRSPTLFPDLHSEVYEFKMAEHFCLFLFRGANISIFLTWIRVRTRDFLSNAYRSGELMEIPKFNNRTGLNKAV